MRPKFVIPIRGVVKKYQDNYDQLFKQAKLDELCADGESRSAFLIRFALNHPGISTMIIGSKNSDHLAANIQAVAKGKLPDDVYREAKLRLDAVDIVVERQLGGGAYCSGSKGA